MTPQEIHEYKVRWLNSGGHAVTVNEDSDVDGKVWCRKNLERHQWSFSKFTDMYEHTFFFENPEHAREFEQWYDSRMGYS